jgi:hypothetical protein
MANLGETFDTEQMDLGDDLLPPGEYFAQAIEAELKDTQSGGTMLTFTFEILDGDFQGRRIWERLNYINNNEMAQRIARREMGRFAMAIGLNTFSDTEDFLFKPVRIDVAIRKDKNGQYPDQNGIKKYLPVDGGPEALPSNSNVSSARSTGNGGSQSANRAAPSQQRAAAGGGSRPWDRR